MAEEKEKEIIGYYTDDRNIYCVDCILKNQEMMKKKIEKAITIDDTEGKKGGRGEKRGRR
jgi:hypothetical protein